MFLPALLIACEQFVQSAGKSQLWCWLWDSHASAEVGDSIWRWHRPSPCSKQGQQSSLPTAMISWLGNTSKGWKPTGSPDNVLLCSSIMRGKVLFSYVLPKFESVLSQGTTQKNLYSLLQVFIQMDHISPGLLQEDHPRSLVSLCTKLLITSMPFTGLVVPCLHLPGNRDSWNGLKWITWCEIL